MDAPSDSLAAFFRHHGFDVLDVDPEWPGLYVAHPDSDDEAERMPLLVVADETGYRVSVGQFGADGELRPGLSASFDRDHRPTLGTTSFGGPLDAQQAADQLIDAVRQIYARSRTVEPF